MKALIIKYCCLSALLLLLSMSLLKEHTPWLNNYFNVQALQGYFPEVEKLKLSKQTWFDGSFQKSKEEQLKRDLKIRPYAVRVNNQLHFNVLDEIRSDVVKGEEGYLFGARYIGAIQGRDFIGSQKIKVQCEKLAVIRDTFKNRFDTDIIVVLAYDKSRYFKDKLPKRYDLVNVDTTNYEMFVKYLQEENIYTIDFNKYFIEQKDKTEHRLGSKNGIHWTSYGGILAADSLLNFIGSIKGKNVNRIYKGEIFETTIVKGKDNDIGESLNLYTDLETQTFSYFENYIKMDSAAYKPNIALIGDSFCWTIWEQEIPHNYWGDNSMFMYYFNQIWKTKADESPGAFIDKAESLNYFTDKDAIVLLYTPMNLNIFGNEFVDEMHKIVH